MYHILCRTLAIAILWSCANSLPILAQTSDFIRRTDIEVTANNLPLAMPWIGGFNNVQFSDADFDQDGIADLLLFDRSGNSATVLRNSGATQTLPYTEAPHLAQYLPPLHDWVLMRDYNCDNIPDIFTGNSTDGIALYSGYYSNNMLHFSLINNQLQYTNADNTLVPLIVSFADIPDISDIDGDGRVDILTFNPAGGYVFFLRNTSPANNCSALSFELETSCWGQFYESGLESTLTLNMCDDGGRMASSERHPGSTVLTFDMDGDNDREILLGDISFNNLVLGVNGGNAQQAHVTSQDTNFPDYDMPLHLEIFPAPFLVDVDNDGKKDLLVTPNTVAQSEHYRCIWYYKNTGSGSQQTFSFQKDTFLIDQTIDVNRLSYPVFFDHNSDGLLDIVIGNAGYRQPSGGLLGALALYENIGTATQPAYRLITRDYAQVQSQFALPRASLHPTFGDLDGDGDADMLLGDEGGYIHYFKNNPVNGIAQFTLFAEQFQGLDIVQHAAPCLADINNDGLLDLAVGHKNGNIRYFQNTGTTNAPVFTLQNNLWGGIDVRLENSVDGYATPFLIKKDGQWLLFCGAYSGQIRLYNQIENGGNFNLITDNLLPNLANVVQVAPAVADVNANGQWDVVIGNYKGGLYWFEQQYPVNTNLAPAYEKPQSSWVWHIDAQKTPNKLFFHCSKASCTTVDAIWLYDISGKLVAQQPVETMQNGNIAIEVSLPYGVYIAALQQNQTPIQYCKVLVN